MIQFDEHNYVQLGGFNHQLVGYLLDIGDKLTQFGENNKPFLSGSPTQDGS